MDENNKDIERDNRPAASFRDRPITHSQMKAPRRINLVISMLIRRKFSHSSDARDMSSFSFDEHDAGNQEPGSGGDLDTVRKGKTACLQTSQLQ